jgi:hypothetical protein
MTLTGAAMLMVVLLTGCVNEDSPTTATTPALAVEGAGHHTTDHTKFVETFVFALTSPCNGELIVISGEAISQVTEMVGLHFEYQSSLLATGTGPESGAVYTLNDTFHEGFNTPSVTASQFTFIQRSAARVTSDLPGLSFTVHLVFHGVSLPSGEFKVTRDVDGAECKV